MLAICDVCVSRFQSLHHLRRSFLNYYPLSLQYVMSVPAVFTVYTISVGPFLNYYPLSLQYVMSDEPFHSF